MSDVITIATKRLETLKAEIAKIEQFLAFAAELEAADSGKPAAAAPTRAPEAKPAESKPADSEKSGDSDAGGFQLTRDHMVASGGGLRDTARRVNGS